MSVPKKPTKVRVGTEMYRVVVLKVEGRAPDGRPRECRFVYDEESVHVADGDEFITAFVPSATIAKRAN